MKKIIVIVSDEKADDLFDDINMLFDHRFENIEFEPEIPKYPFVTGEYNEES